ncbi:MAG: hypothetical protein KIT31_26570 [Deltaproteobacteria bacterium]|nr:hypothetical protein [Deltaproteobacteria bacterium]
MATKKTEKTTAKAEPSARGQKPVKTVPSKKSRAASTPKPAKKTTAKKGPKPEPKPQGPRHPKAKVVAKHGDKAALAKSIAGALAIGDESADVVETRLKTASNAQLLRLAAVAETVKQKWGSREKLIAAIGAAAKKSKDQDYLTRLGSYSLPQLVDIAKSAERRA